MKTYSGTLTDPPCDGTIVRLAGEEYLIPPLSFKMVKKWQPIIDKFRKTERPPPDGETPEQEMARVAENTKIAEERGERMIDIILDAMKRNYPELTRDALEDLCDMQSTNAAYRASLGIAGETKPLPTTNQAPTPATAEAVTAVIPADPVASANGPG